jgi:hypothetical protein
MINVSYFCRSAAAGVLAAPLWNARSWSSRSSTWFFNESLVKTPMAFVSFKRCSSEPKSSVGALGDSGAAGFAAAAGADVAGFGCAAPEVWPGFGSGRLAGALVAVPLAEGVAGAFTAAGGTGTGAGAGGAGDGGGAGGGAGSGAMVAGCWTAGRDSASWEGRCAAQPDNIRDAAIATAEIVNRAMYFTRRDINSLPHTAPPKPQHREWFTKAPACSPSRTAPTHARR